jgi:hypothetical protein
VSRSYAINAPGLNYQNNITKCRMNMIMASDLSFSLMHGDIGDRRPVPTTSLISKGLSVLVTNNY